MVEGFKLGFADAGIDGICNQRSECTDILDSDLGVRSLKFGARNWSMGYGVRSLEYGVDAAMWSVNRRRAEESGDEDSEATRGDARRKTIPKKGFEATSYTSKS